MIRECSPGMYHDPDRGFNPQKIPSGKTLIDLEIDLLKQEARYCKKRDLKLSQSIEVDGVIYKTDDQTKSALMGRKSTFKFKAVNGYFDLTPEQSEAAFDAITEALQTPRDKHVLAEAKIDEFESLEDISDFCVYKFWESL